MTKFPNSSTMKKKSKKKQNDQLPTLLTHVHVDDMEIKFLNDQIPKFYHSEKNLKKKTK